MNQVKVLNEGVNKVNILNKGVNKARVLPIIATSEHYFISGNQTIQVDKEVSKQDE